MASLLKRVWWNLTQPGWHTVPGKTAHHPALGELKYEGSRLRPDGPVTGIWRLTVPGVAKPISVAFPTDGGDPTPLYLDRLAALLADQDGLFERFRTAIAPAYAQITESNLPADWRSVMRLDDIGMLAGPEDVDEEGTEWRVTYWCEPCLHWVVVSLDGDEVTDVGIEG